MIGIEASPLEQIALAASHGFEAVDLDMPNIADTTAVREAMDQHNIKPGRAGGLVPGKTGVDDEEWSASVETLPKHLATARELGFTRTTSVVLPFHETLDYDACRQMHIERMKQVAPILAEANVRLGLEYVSQKTRRAGYENVFAFNLADLLDVVNAAGQPNVGLLLDSFHWYCANESVDDIRRLTNEQVIVVHINDAIADRSIDEQIAFERELPGASGVIDLEGFIDALRAIDYDGPVTAEPMNAELNAMPAEAKLVATCKAMDELLGRSR
jgi:sugar phosphate isomerase/epimerase